MMFWFSFPCQAQEKSNIGGRYIAADYSDLIEKVPIFYFLSGTTEVLGSDLNLKKNASFIYRNCSTIVRGKWEVENDTLWLFTENNRWRSDSLDKHGLSGKHPQIKQKMGFKIGKGFLQREFLVKYNDRKLTAVETLVKDTLER